MVDQGDSRLSVSVVPLEYAPPCASSGGWAMRLAWSAVVVSAIGTLLIPFISVETVVVSGPLLAVIGGVLTGVAAAKRRWVLVIIGSGHLAIVGLFAGLVNSFNWSPDYAVVPFLVMAFIWTAVAATGTALSVRLECLFAIKASV